MSTWEPGRCFEVFSSCNCFLSIFFGWRNTKDVFAFNSWCDCEFNFNLKLFMFLQMDVILFFLRTFFRCIIENDSNITYLHFNLFHCLTTQLSSNWTSIRTILASKYTVYTLKFLWIREYACFCKSVISHIAGRALLWINNTKLQVKFYYRINGICLYILSCIDRFN